MVSDLGNVGKCRLAGHTEGGKEARPVGMTVCFFPRHIQLLGAGVVQAELDLTRDKMC